MHRREGEGLLKTTLKTSNLISPQWYVICNTLGVLNALEADRESLIDLEHCGQPSLQCVFLWRVTFWRCRDPDELVGLPKVTCAPNTGMTLIAWRSPDARCLFLSKVVLPKQLFCTI